MQKLWLSTGYYQAVCTLGGEVQGGVLPIAVCHVAVVVSLAVVVLGRCVRAASPCLGLGCVRWRTRVWAAASATARALVCSVSVPSLSSGLRCVRAFSVPDSGVSGFWCCPGSGVSRVSVCPGGVSRRCRFQAV